MDENSNFFIVFIVVMVILFAGNYLAAETRCTAKAEALGYMSDYKFFQGCVLEKPNGKKVLLEQLRDFE